ncbi:TonB C-terminal domain-containing protein [Desulfoluna butyratoxydans]|uniref:TonB C-terminal domain-containing protein n=1 Tax=Desulfoluna butyratoxydans TaxID=231438 RepID=UPI0015D0F6D5|nr:TonB C-terminal domain-containing protein [Desulfoluna butyratoxydans]
MRGKDGHAGALPILRVRASQVLSGMIVFNMWRRVILVEKKTWSRFFELLVRNDNSSIGYCWCKVVFPLSLISSVMILMLVGCISKHNLQKNENADAVSCLTSLEIALRENWHFSGDTEPDFRTIISFEVDPMSKVRHLQITKSSGSDTFDLSAVRCIEELSPFNQIDGVSNDCFIDHGFKEFVIEFDVGHLK